MLSVFGKIDASVATDYSDKDAKSDNVVGVEVWRHNRFADTMLRIGFDRDANEMRVGWRQRPRRWGLDATLRPIGRPRKRKTTKEGGPGLLFS
jgi:hypothetical protein